MRRRGDPIPLDELPTRLDPLDQVIVWHVRRVIRDSNTLDEAAERIGRSKKTLWGWRRRFAFTDQPRDDG